MPPGQHASRRRSVLSRLIKRSFSLAGHRTSVALEPEFWSALLRIAGQRGQSLSALVSATDGARAADQPLASALRVMALRAFETGATGAVEPEAGTKPDEPAHSGPV